MMQKSYKPRILALYIGLVFFTLLVIAGVAFPFVYWHMQPDIPLNVWIVDKTVPVPDYREHKGLMWALNHYKIVSEKTEKSFRYDQDYFGFFPLTEEIYDVRPIPDVKEDIDLIYLTDTYGVYTDDYMIPNVRGTHSEIIYGGLQTDEMNIIRQNLHGNTVIGEFNIASSPTNVDNRLELETVFGIKSQSMSTAKICESNTLTPQWRLMVLKKWCRITTGLSLPSQGAPLKSWLVIPWM